MRDDFMQEVFFGFLVKGQLRAALAYLGRFPGQSELYKKYMARFQEERYAVYGVEEDLNRILLAYQKYYRESFYLELPPEEAAGRLGERLAKLLGAAAGTPLDRLEEDWAEAFRRRSLYILTGRTGDWYGPYLWREEETRRYTVELPEGTREYAVKLLDGFLMKSWLDYLSFGAAGTGGWSNGGGLIHCVRSAYDLDSESFRVSLLKHEAQHGADLEKYPGITPADLEYRGKLVELIYTRERPLLGDFLLQAGPSGGSHGVAAERIAQRLMECLDLRREELSALPAEEVRAASLEIFRRSTAEMDQKYRQPRDS